MAVYDCCLFFNENDIYEIRLNQHWDFVDKFIAEATANPGNRYYVVGFDYCGLGSWPVSEIAPLFGECTELGNVYLPLKIWENIVEAVQ